MIDFNQSAIGNSMQRCLEKSLDVLLATLPLGLILLSTGCGQPQIVDNELQAFTTSDQEETNHQVVTTDNDTIDYIDKTFDDIAFDLEINSEYDESKLTDEIRAMDGKQIRIRGYILPTARRSGLKQFVLVRDNLECCFGPGAALYDCILVDMQEGKSAEFSIRPVAVEGKFTLSIFEGPDGIPLAIYHLQGDSVR